MTSNAGRSRIGMDERSIDSRINLLGVLERGTRVKSTLHVDCIRVCQVN